MYASDTIVPIEKSKAEIERTVARYGAEGFASAWNSTGKAQIEFLCHGKRIRFILTMPSKDDREFTHFEGRETKRKPAVAEKLWEQGCRQRWRALALCIRAKLEAVESGITAFETEFMAHILLPNGKTAGEHYAPAIESAYKTGKVPLALTFDGGA